ncbi:MAG TPA: choice-of-anchor J domain-containing protein, partial [Bacteroidales bacterium]|nr:choice-of-anchor J domain-containing protein [Bacteroidales bacterium]
IARDVLVTGNLIFWSNCYQGSVHLDHYYVKISENSGGSWQPVLDLSSLPPYPGPNGYNQWNTPYTVDLSSYLGQVIDIAWQAVDGDGQGLWYGWSIDDCTVGGDKIYPDQPSAFQGYDVYRRNNLSGPWVRINTAPVPDTLYIDNGLMDGSYEYYITLSMEECSSAITTDTLFFDIVTGMPDKERLTQLSIYPNPADGYCVIHSPQIIDDLIIIDPSGKIIYHHGKTDKKELKIITTEFPSGLFFIKVTASGKVCLQKLLILR